MGDPGKRIVRSRQEAHSALPATKGSEYRLLTESGTCAGLCDYRTTFGRSPH